MVKQKVFFSVLFLFVVSFIFSFSLAEVTIDRADINEVSAVDTSLDSSYGISLDFIEDGATHKVLEIDLGSSRSVSAHDLLFLITNLDFSGSQVVNEQLFVLRTENITSTIATPSCTDTYELQTNGSLMYVESCSYRNSTETVSVDSWEEVALDSFTGSEESFTGTLSVEGRYFRYSFDVPLVERENSYGSSGRTYVGVNGNTFVDLQHSSWWNTSFPYRRAIQINNSGSAELKQYYTLEVSGIDTTNASNFNRSNVNNFAVVCDQTEVDVIIGNETDLQLTNTTALYGSSTGYAQINTTILFRLPTSVASSTINNTLCYVYYAELSYISSQNNISEIALFYDDFTRADSTTVGKNWQEGAADFSIVSNGVEAVANNPMMFSSLDIGSCSDCELMETLYWYKRNAAASGSGHCIGVDSNNAQAGSGNCEVASGNGGAFSKFSDESAFFGFFESDGVNNLFKQASWSVPSGASQVVRAVSLGTSTTGDYIAYIDNSYVSWAVTNNTVTDPNAIRSYVRMGANRNKNRIEYVMVKRWMRTPPTISIGSEENVASSYETDGDSSIVAGIQTALPLAQIYSDQQVYVRYDNGTQMLGRFDKVALYRNQRWAFNYITTGESFTYMYDMSPSLYVWENQSLTSAQIQSQVTNRILATLITQG